MQFFLIRVMWLLLSDKDTVSGTGRFPSEYSAGNVSSSSRKNMAHLARCDNHGEGSGVCGPLCCQWVQHHCLLAQGSF